MAEFQDGHRYYIEGSHGKGLEITAKSNGTHLFFCGGTGILPFLDTFAYMLRKAVHEHDESKDLFKDEEFNATGENFKLVLYAFYTKRSEAIGLDIIEGIKLLQEKTGKDFGIEINLIFTREGGKRLTKDKALELVKETNANNKISKLFVCGPPPQNIMFNELGKEIRETLGLSILDYFVL